MKYLVVKETTSFCVCGNEVVEQDVENAFIAPGWTRACQWAGRQNRAMTSSMFECHLIYSLPEMQDEPVLCKRVENTNDDKLTGKVLEFPI